MSFRKAQVTDPPVEAVQLTRFLVSAEGTGLPFTLVFNKVRPHTAQLQRCATPSPTVGAAALRQHAEDSSNARGRGLLCVQVDLMSPEEREDYEGRLR